MVTCMKTCLIVLVTLLINKSLYFYELEGACLLKVYMYTMQQWVLSAAWQKVITAINDTWHLWPSCGKLVIMFGLHVYLHN